jgi:UDP-N-acetylmuramyl pentapeptide phosphotransferase/UDP-N-acetylglucosamine-1-phosphate transferase
MRKIHQNPIPLLGSIAIYFGFLIGMIFSGPNLFVHQEALIILCAGTMLLVVGILDDAGILHPQIKLMVAMPVAGLILTFLITTLKSFQSTFLITSSPFSGSSELQLPITFLMVWMDFPPESVSLRLSFTFLRVSSSNI